jgi:addiction module HigA family antidote
MALTAIHPSEHLAEELEALDMSAAELARKIDVPTNRVTQILKGTHAITGDTSLRLAYFFGTSAQFWLNLQSLYDPRLTQEKVGKSIKALCPFSRAAPPEAPTISRQLRLHTPHVPPCFAQCWQYLQFLHA